MGPESTSPSRLGRLWWPWLVGSLLCMWAPVASAQLRCPVQADWPAWTSVREQFVSADGRVVDPSSPRRVTTSEGQAYGLFFALAAGDREAFGRVLQWTENNLAEGDLGQRLPAWEWGRHDDDSWSVLDTNAAADADLWMAYALGEAGRLWHEPRYLALAKALASHVLKQETKVLDGVGRTLLAGPVGFGPLDHAGIVRIKSNPSYLPLPVLRWLAAGPLGEADAWHDVLVTAVRALKEGSPTGLAPDWLMATTGNLAGPARWIPTADQGLPAIGDDGAVTALAQGEPIGSYNAIRVYLWLGITHPQDPDRAALLSQFAPMADLTARRSMPPEVVFPLDGRGQGEGPPGFSAALLPFLDALGRDDLVRAQEARLAAEPLRSGAYYEQALGLFALGYREGWYRFDARGFLQPKWTTACAAATNSPR